MKRRAFSPIVATALFLCALSTLVAEQTAPIKVACIGDSITFGAGLIDRDENSYPAQLARALGEKWSVKNFGVSTATVLKKGNKPYWSLPQYQAALEFMPDVVVFKLGTNDSKPENWQRKAEYVPDYFELIKSFQKLESKPTIWICYPVPAYSGKWGISDKVIKEEVIPLIDEVAQKADVKIIDLYSALSDKKQLFPDAIHPNEAGAKLIAETIFRTIIVHQPR